MRSSSMIQCPPLCKICNIFNRIMEWITTIVDVDSNNDNVSQYVSIGDFNKLRTAILKMKKHALAKFSIKVKSKCSFYSI
jgi:hypothetical protein